MRKTWKDRLPPAICRQLGRIKAALYRTVMRALCVLFSRCPIRPNKIAFDNYQGRGYSCNPKYVVRKLMEMGADGYDLVWLVSREHMAHSELPPQIRTVRYGSARSYYEYATARVWVSNYPKTFYVKNGLKKRAGQVFIQMCHGSLGIKKIDGDVAAFVQDKTWLRAAIASAESTDWWISDSAFETGVYKSAFWGVPDEKILLYGHPRNDIFFDGEMTAGARRKVDGIYGTGGKRILLYAPTFREDYRTDCYRIDFPELLRHLGLRFGGEWTAMVRMHPRIAGMGIAVPAGPGIIDVTGYMDMQELLAAADCMVTDYSSCVFDFMLTRRPAFIFAPDRREYDTERGFYYPLERTPFPIAEDSGQLLSSVARFDAEEYARRVDAFLREKGCIEDGHASGRVAELIAGLVHRQSGAG